MRISFDHSKVDTKTGTSKRTGKPYAIRTQEGVAETGKFRLPVRIMLADEQAAYEPGSYTVDLATALTVGRFGDIEVARNLQLVREVPRTAAAARA